MAAMALIPEGKVKQISNTIHRQRELNVGLLWKTKHGFPLILCVAKKDSSIFTMKQGTKKFRSDSPGLVDFIVGQVEVILHLSDRQIKVFRKIFL